MNTACLKGLILVSLKFLVNEGNFKPVTQLKPGPGFCSKRIIEKKLGFCQRQITSTESA